MVIFSTNDNGSKNTYKVIYTTQYFIQISFKSHLLVIFTQLLRIDLKFLITHPIYEQTRPILSSSQLIYCIFWWAYTHLEPNIQQVNSSNVVFCRKYHFCSAFVSYVLCFPAWGESITRKVSQLTNQIRRDIKKTNDPGEMGADKCVLFSPDLPPSLASSQRARAWRVWIGDLITEETVRASGARAREGRWRTKRSQRTKWGIGREKGDKSEIGEGKGEGKVDEYENYSLDARTGRTLVKMAHGIN